MNGNGTTAVVGSWIEKLSTSTLVLVGMYLILNSILPPLISSHSKYLTDTVDQMKAQTNIMQQALDYQRRSDEITFSKLDKMQQILENKR